MTTPVERLSGLVVGTVESVAPHEIKVLLELDAPHSTALNTGTPSAFPRLNGYVLIPNESGATVGYVSWIGIERSPYPKRSGFKDFGLIDLPFPLRKMAVSPLGTLTTRRDLTSKRAKYELARGVAAFPSVGDQVLIPTKEQVEAIVGANDPGKRVRLGLSPMASSAPIMVDPNKIFGRHLAVLGNTGSGKSCTVAGLIRWSLDAAKANLVPPATEPNARFIVLDPNGEYAKAFQDLGDKCRLFRVPPIKGSEKPLDVPAWLWNGHEWSVVAHAQPGAQRPLLMQGLRELKSGSTSAVSREAIIRRYLTSFSVRLSAMLNQGNHAFAGSVPARFAAAHLFKSIADDTTSFVEGVTDQATINSLQEISAAANAILALRKSNGIYYNDFHFADLESIRTSLDVLAETLPDTLSDAPVGEDSPLPFDVDLLAEHLNKIATEQGGNLAAFISTLGLRIRGMLSDQRLSSVIARKPHITLEQWLGDYIGEDKAKNGPLAIIDLSLVPTELIYIVVAVLGRVVFEAMQRYRRQHTEGKPLPTVLVLEEAHTFVRRSREEIAIETAHSLCRETFEKIAREGRKFGLGLVLSSQRPSELSPTVLAQCNTFLLHRIVNDADQDLVARLVPDNVGGLLKELPSLPSRQALLLGWATPIPVLVEVSQLPDSQRPQSDDPDFWDVWTGTTARSVNWKSISDDWSGKKATP